MNKTDRERAIALAGIFQAAALVRDVAYAGQADAGDSETCLRSIFAIDAPDIEAVYGGLHGLRRGLRLLASELRTPREMEIARYTVNLLVLERKLRTNPALTDQLQTGIRNLTARLGDQAAIPADIIAALGDLYSDTISTLSPRIMVNGEQTHLSRRENATCIRALLLAGVRAAWLWVQAGGGRLTLLLRRRALLAESQRLLREIGD